MVRGLHLAGFAPGGLFVEGQNRYNSPFYSVLNRKNWCLPDGGFRGPGTKTEKSVCSGRTDLLSRYLSECKKRVWITREVIHIKCGACG